MALPKYRFKCWCEKAVSGIVFPPDQQKVYQELMDHMEDRYDELMQQGYDDDIAQTAAVDAMGDPWPIAKELAAIHRPFWGYFLRATRILLVIVTVIALIPVIRYFWSGPYGQPRTYRYDPYADTYISDHVGITQRILYTEPDKTLSAGVYRITLARAAWHHTDFAEGEDRELDSFQFQFEVFCPIPWLDYPKFLGHIWAEDSLGNYYYSMEADVPSDTPQISGADYRTGPFTYIFDMAASDFCSQEAEWIALHYTRDGNDLTFYIDLTGGDAP